MTTRCVIVAADESFRHGWRHKETQYWKCTGSQWSSVKTIGASGWRTTGTPGNLAFHTLDQDVDLPGGACVKQRLKLRWYMMFGDPSDWDWTGYAGRWDEHYLE